MIDLFQNKKTFFRIYSLRTVQQIQHYTFKNQHQQLFLHNQHKVKSKISKLNLKIFFSAIRPVNSSNIQFLNASSNSTVRPIIFNQKGTSNSNQPQLLTVMPAGVRFQQLTPVVRASSNQPTTIVRLMSPSNSTGVRTTTNQQQFIQLNTNKQQQPLVIKAITTSNRQQQPILLAANTQQKTILPQNQQQQVLVLNQNTFNNNQGQQQTKFTFQMTNNDNNQQEPTTKDNNIPQLDGTVDDQVRLSSLKRKHYILIVFIVSTKWFRFTKFF